MLCNATRLFSVVKDRGRDRVVEVRCSGAETTFGFQNTEEIKRNTHMQSRRRETPTRDKHKKNLMRKFAGQQTRHGHFDLLARFSHHSQYRSRCPGAIRRARLPDHRTILYRRPSGGRRLQCFDLPSSSYGNSPGNCSFLEEQGTTNL